MEKKWGKMTKNGNEKMQEKGYKWKRKNVGKMTEMEKKKYRKNY